MAERGGFEPPIRLPVCRISSAVHSTTLPPLRPSARIVRAASSLRRAEPVRPRPPASAAELPRHGRRLSARRSLIKAGCLGTSEKARGPLRRPAERPPGVGKPRQIALDETDEPSPGHRQREDRGHPSPGSRPLWRRLPGCRRLAACGVRSPSCGVRCGRWSDMQRRTDRVRRHDRTGAAPDATLRTTMQREDGAEGRGPARAAPWRVYRAGGARSDGRAGQETTGGSGASRSSSPASSVQAASSCCR